MVAQWLKAGVVEQGRLHRTEAGVPQGGNRRLLIYNHMAATVMHSVGLDRLRRAGLRGERSHNRLLSSIRGW